MEKKSFGASKKLLGRRQSPGDPIARDVRKEDRLMAMVDILGKEMKLNT